MKTRFKSTLVGLAILLFAFAPLTLNAAPMTNADVIKMVEAGIDESVIITAIQKAQSGFDTSPDGLIALSQAKVSKEIINAMVTRSSERGARGRPVAQPAPVDKDTPPTRRFYVSASVVHATSSGNGATGFGTAFGFVIGKRHNIETELMYWKQNWNNYGYYSYSSGSTTSIPVLATYRFGIPFGSSRWGLQVGGSLGFSSNKSDGYYYSSYSSYSWYSSSSSTNFAYGPQVLLTFRISSRFSAHTGARYLWSDKTWSDNSSDAFKYPIFTLGASFRF